MTEKITEIVREKIENFTYGYVFSASDFPIDVTKQKSVNKVLENLTKAGKIRRLSKGRYYKTKTTEFGELAEMRQKAYHKYLKIKKIWTHYYYPQLSEL